MIPRDMPHPIAPKGAIWVCGACGKTSPDRYGNRESTRGWDVSCAMNSSLFYIDSLVRGEDGRVTEGKAFVPEEKT